MKLAICQSCGSIADKQSDVVLNGSEQLFSCPICKGSWQEASRDSLPIQLETISKEQQVTLRGETQKNKEETGKLAEALNNWAKKEDALCDYSSLDGDY